MWELLVTDEDRTFEHAEFFPNNRINSVEVRYSSRESKNL